MALEELMQWKKKFLVASHPQCRTWRWIEKPEEIARRKKERENY